MLRAGATVKDGFVPVLLRVDMVAVSTGILMRGGRSRPDSIAGAFNPGDHFMWVSIGTETDKLPSNNIYRLDLMIVILFVLLNMVRPRPSNQPRI